MKRFASASTGTWRAYGPLRVVTDNRVRFDFDQHVAVDEPRHLDHAGRWADRPEDFAVCFADVLPIANIGHVDTRTDDVFETRADFLERRLNIFEHLHRLGVRVTLADNTAFCISRRRS